MEKFVFEKLLKRLIEDEHLEIKVVSTDRHNQIRKYMRVEYPAIKHLVDPWHVIKGLIKKLNVKATKKSCESLGKHKLYRIKYDLKYE